MAASFSQDYLPAGDKLAAIADAVAPDVYVFPTSFAQQRLWFLDQLEPGSALYNIPMAVYLEGRLDIKVLEQTLNEIVRRHEVFRTTFAVSENNPVQLITDSQELQIKHIDLGGFEEAEREARARRLASDEAKTGFDLAAGPLLRVTLLHLEPEKHVVLFNMHHIISDGWSLGVLVKEVVALYDAFTKGQASPLPELSIQYADYAAWQRDWLQGEVLEQQLSYWKRQLGGELPVLDLPTDRPRAAVRSYRGAEKSFRVGSEIAAQLRQLCQSEGCTLFMTLLAAFQVLLCRYSGQDEVAVGTAIANRNRAEIEPLIGFFINTLVLRTDLSGDPSFRDLLRRVREVTLGAYAHQDVPFEKLVEELEPERDLSRSPLFQVMFVLQNAPSAPLQLPGLKLSALGTEGRSAKFELTLGMTERGDELVGTFEYDTDLFDASTVERLVEHFEVLLAGIAAAPDTRLAELPLLKEAERQQILVEWNDTRVDFPNRHCVHELFQVQAEKTPAAVALVCGAERITYRELNARANQLARYLRRLGVGAEKPVGVCLGRSSEMVVAVLATLKAGGAYVPLDPAYPRERLAFILRDSNAFLVLSDDEFAGALPDTSARTVFMKSEWPAISEEDSSNLSGVAQPQNLAYVIYTSGSTGQPKGVAIEHRSTTAFLQWALATFSIEELSGVLLSTSLCFDLSVFELFAPLCMGGKVVLVENALSLPDLDSGEVTLVNTVPSAMTELVRVGGIPSSVRTVNLAGEPLGKSLVDDVYERSNVQSVFNLYGPSEDTTYSTFARLQKGATAEPSIGRPVANTCAYILDAQLHPVPIGVPGNLHLGGAGLARGYLNRPELTAEKFIPDPFSATPGERLYRTGDLVRYRPDGELEFLGRIDQQVKLRGYRIELGEIEAALVEQAGVREAVVIAREERAGEKRLVAYIATEPGIEIGRLRQALKEKLPEYMVPAAFVELTALPLTPNGKLDRRALPAPGAGAFGGEQVYIGPRTPVEEVLAGIFCEVLKLKQVGVAENFFELGGHSLLATQVVSRVRENFQVEIPLRSVFESPTVAALALAIESARGTGASLAAPPITAVRRDERLPLSFAQQRLWFLDQLEPGSAFYNSPLAVRLTGELNVAALERTLTEIIRRHESLRTRFASEGGEPVQVIDTAREIRLTPVELSSLGEAEREAEARRLASEEAQRPFDLATGPLLRVQLLRLAEQEHVVLFTMHHIISDGWSLGVLMKEVATLYEAFGKAEESEPGAVATWLSPLPELSIQYADYAAWQRAWLQGEVLEEQLSYWKRQLGGELPVLELPTDRPRPPVQTHRGAQESFRLDRELAEQLQALSQREGCTLFMTLLAAFQTLLARYSGQDEIVVGTAIANRNRAETEPLIGFFINTLALRTDLSGDPSFVELLRRVREVTLGAYAHQDIPFEKLVEELEPGRDMSRAPLFQVMFILQNAPATALQLPGLRLSGLGSESKTAKFDLMLTMGERGDELVGTLEYNTDLFEPETIRRMSGHLGDLLRGVVFAPEQKVWETELVGEEERRQLLVAWNDTGADYEREASIGKLFEQQVERSAEAVALVYKAEQLSYRALNERANQLAHHLQGLGVKSEVLVGICMDRSLDLIVSLLAILKAGGAYVPLDPTYPPERLGFMLDDAAISVLLTQSHLLPALPLTRELPVVSVDTDWPLISEQRKDNPETRVQPETLAYVIYTSGSTGTPKGVMISHASVVNLWSALSRRIFNHQPGARLDPRLANQSGEQTFRSRRLSLNASLSFDASVQQWTRLLSGDALYLVPPEARRDAEEMCRYVTQNQIEVLDCTPSQLRAWTAAGMWAENNRAGAVVPVAPALLIVGGEAVEPAQWEEMVQLSPRTQFYNVYGPTECTVDTVACEVSGATPRIGRALANTRTYVIERHGWLKLAGVGMNGELYLGGDGLARGYLNRPELTAEKFVPNPFSTTPGERLYRTGDLARYRRDGELEFLGRIDQQVKLRGYRIELGEIEAALMAQAGVSEAVVIVREESAGDKRLMAYLVSESEIDIGHLRQALREKLPDYMVPAAFLQLEVLPLTANGKLDRRALPAPGAGATGAEQEYVGPRTPAEEVLAGVFAEVLGLERVSITDNFFELGGNSLLAVRLMACIEQKTGTALPLASLFRAPTVELFAAALSAQVENEEWSPLVKMQSGDGRLPFFCVHPGGGNVFCYAELSARLGNDRPFYGLQAYGVDGKQAPLKTIEEMASRYLKAMMRVQSQGPYFLGGWSLGGLIAFEMAQQLASQGEQIALLALFDTSVPSRQPAQSAAEADTSLLLSFAQDFGVAANGLNISLKHFEKLQRDDQLAYVLEQAKAAGNVPAEVQLAQMRGLLRVFEGNVRAGESYVAGRYQGRLLFFKASDASANQGRDVSLGWQDLADGGLEVCIVPGDHYNMLKPPQVQILAERMKRCFNEAEEKYPT